MSRRIAIDCGRFARANSDLRYFKTHKGTFSTYNGVKEREYARSIGLGDLIRPSTSVFAEYISDADDEARSLLQGFKTDSYTRETLLLMFGRLAEWVRGSPLKS